MANSVKNINTHVIKTVLQTVSEYGMLNKGDSVLTAISGGPDSVALLHVLKELASTFLLRLGIAHLNHGIRGKDSDQDAEFTASLAQQLSIPFYTEKVDVPQYKSDHKLSLEQAARRVRYDFFSRMSITHKFNKIAIGHHADDNAEMILMALFRGSGPLGLSGIPPVRDIRDNTIIRPLIRLTKSEIEEYVSVNKLSYVIDASNRDTKYFRNKIRHELIPVIRHQYNPKITGSLNRLADIVRMEEDWTEQLTAPLFQPLLSEKANQSIALYIPQIMDLHIAAKRRLIRFILRKIKKDLKRITFDHIDAVIRLMEDGPVRGRLDLPDRILVRRNHDDLLFSKENKRLRSIKTFLTEDDIRDYIYYINLQKPVHVKEINAIVSFMEKDVEQTQDVCSAGQKVAFFDIKKIQGPLMIRNFRSDDRFIPLGMTGRQTVKKFLANHKVPRQERCGWPVLTDKDKILWVMGHRIDDAVKVTSSTRKVLKAEIRYCI